MNVRANAVPDWWRRIGVTRRPYGSVNVALIFACHVVNLFWPSAVLISRFGVALAAIAPSRFHVRAKLASSDQLEVCRLVAVTSQV